MRSLTSGCVRPLAPTFEDRTPDIPVASQNASCRDLNEARQHLALFFDFLESHSLITSTEHAVLISFPAATSSNAASGSASASASASASPNGPEEDERSGVAKRLWEDWIQEVKVKYAGKLQDANVEGWFEIYRVRGNFVVLKEKELRAALSLPLVAACSLSWQAAILPSTPSSRPSSFAFRKTWACSSTSTTPSASRSGASPPAPPGSPPPSCTSSLPLPSSC